MIRVSSVMTNLPDTYRTDLQKRVYELLDEIEVPFFRVENDPAVTMKDCIEIDRVLETRIVKTIFLTNRQKNRFYLYVTTADKPFVTKDFSGALGVARVSFAPESLMMEKVGTKAGACTIFGLLMDEENEIRLVIDEDVKKSEWYGCTDSTSTGYFKIKTDDLFEKVIPSLGNTPEIIKQ